MVNHFDLTDMQLLVNIIDAKSLTRGAERSHLSLPAASNRVKNMEYHLGTPLLYRRSQGVAPTPSGEAFVRHARIVLRQLEHLRGDMQEYARGIKGQVRICANTTAMGEFMPTVLSRYLAAHPDVNVQLQERPSSAIVKSVADGAIDVGVVAGRIQADQVQFLPCHTDRLVLVVPPAHPLAAREAVAFADTFGENHVCLSDWSAIHAFLVQAAAAQGFALRFRAEVGSFEAVCRMIEARVGIGIVPELSARRYARTLAIRVVPLSDAWAVRELQVCVRALELLPVFARDLVGLMVAGAVCTPAARTETPGQHAEEKY